MGIRLRRIPRNLTEKRLLRGVSWRFFRMLLLFGSLLVIFVNFPLPASACATVHPATTQGVCTPAFLLLGSSLTPKLIRGVGPAGWAGTTVSQAAVVAHGQPVAIMKASAVRSNEGAAATLRQWVNLFGDALFLVSLAVPSLIPNGKIGVRAAPTRYGCLPGLKEASVVKP